MFICEELAINNIWCCFCWWCHSRYIFFFLWFQSLLLILLFRRNLSREAEKCEKVKPRHQRQTVTRQRMEPWPPNRNYIKENLALNFFSFLFMINYTLFYYHPIKVEYNWKYFYRNVDLTLSIISIHLSTQIFSQNTNIHYQHIIVKDIIPFIKCHFQTTIFESSCTEKYFLLFCNL